MDLGPWTAPPGHTVEAFRRGARSRLSLDRPASLPRRPAQTHDAVDLRYYDTWYPHPAVGLTPHALANAQRQAELGYPQLQVDMLADLIQSDAHARNLFEHRERVVAHKELVINAADGEADSVAAANALRYAMSCLPVKETIEHLLRGTHRDGYAGVEIDWDVVVVDGRPWVLPCWFTLVPNRRFRIGVEGMIPVPQYPDGSPTGETIVRYDELRLYQLLETPQGHPLRPGKWIVLRRLPSQIARAGLGVTAALYMLAKRYSWRDWIVLCERYGLPWPIVKYDPDASDQASLEVAQRIVKELGSDGGAAVRKGGIEIDIVKGVESSPIQDRHIAYCNSELSKLVNGSTLRNDNANSGGTSGGSYALGSVHDSVAWDEVRADGAMVNERLAEYLAKPFAAYNGVKAAPVFELMVEPDLGPIEFMTMAVQAKDELGIEVSQRQVRSRTGLREPLDDEDKAPGGEAGKQPTPKPGDPSKDEP